MKKTRFHGIRDYLALIVRRKWWILAAFVACAGAATLFALIVPDIYVSKSMILIKQRDISEDFVKDLTPSDPDQRLSSIEKTILSRTSLLKILNEFEKELVQYRGLNDERKVAKLQSKIVIEFPSERIRGSYLPTSHIIIAYSDRDPALAQKITSRLTALFIEQHNLAREEQVFDTVRFFQDELDKVAEKLQQSESNLQALKSKHRNELPSERETNQRTLDRLQMERNTSIEALDRSVSRRLDIERQMSLIPETIPREQAMRTSGAAPARDPLVEAYRQKEQEYKEAIARAKETHPDVQRLKAEMEELKKSLPEGALDNATAVASSGSVTAEGEVNTEQKMAPNPAYLNLQSQLQEVQTEIDIRKREKQRIDQDIERYNRWVENTPRVEQEIAAVLRDNTDLMKQHDDLKAKLDDAKQAESLENQNKGTQFDVLDPANYPLEPAPPKKSFILLVGIGLSLGAGLAVAYVVDMFSPVIYTQSELERALGTQVLVEVPTISNLSDVRRGRKRVALYAASFAALTCVYGGCLYLLYLKQNTLVQLLDPLIERIRG